MNPDSAIYQAWWSTFDSLYKDRRFDIDYDKLAIVAALLVLTESIVHVKTTG